MAEHRRPAIQFSDAPRGTCRWCGEPILHAKGEKRGRIDRRRRWHPACVEIYNSTDPRELRRRVKRRDRGVCAACRLDTYELRRRLKGRGMRARLRARGFTARRSLWDLDHIVPLIDGGSHALENLQTLCVPCHRTKSAREHSARAARQRERSESKQRDVLEREIDDLLVHVDDANARAETLLSGCAPLLRERADDGGVAG